MTDEPRPADLDDQLRDLFAARAALADAVDLDPDVAPPPAATRPTRAKPLAVVAALALVAATVATVVVLSRPTPSETSIRTVTPAEAMALIHDGSEKAKAATTFAYAFSLDLGGIPGAPTCASTSMRSTGRVDVVRGVTEADRDGRTVQITDGLTTYVRSDTLPASFGIGKPWTRISPEQLELVGLIVSPDGPGLFTSTPTGESLDPSAFLDLLERSAGSVEAAGQDTIDGASTTHLVIHLDAAKMDQVTKEEADKGRAAPGHGQADTGQTITPPSTPSNEDLPLVDAWIGDDGYVRRVTMRMQPPTTGTTVPAGPAAFATTFTATMDFTAYGQAPLQVGVPSPDDTQDVGTVPAKAVDMTTFTHTCGLVPAGEAMPNDVLDCMRQAYEQRVGDKTIDEVLADSKGGVTGGLDLSGIDTCGLQLPGQGTGGPPLCPATQPATTTTTTGHPDAASIPSMPECTLPAPGVPELPPECSTLFDTSTTTAASQPTMPVPTCPSGDVCAPDPSAGGPSTTADHPTPCTVCVFTGAPSTSTTVEAPNGSCPPISDAWQKCIEALSKLPPSPDGIAPPMPTECNGVLNVPGSPPSEPSPPTSSTRPSS